MSIWLAWNTLTVLMQQHDACAFDILTASPLHRIPGALLHEALMDNLKSSHFEKWSMSN